MTFIKKRQDEEKKRRKEEYKGITVREDYTPEQLAEQMKREQRLKEEVKMQREELLRQYKSKLKWLMDDEGNAVAQYGLIIKMADTLHFDIDVAELRKILGDEERHKVMIGTILGLRAH